jgi:hypothetical protein
MAPFLFYPLTIQNVGVRFALSNKLGSEIIGDRLHLIFPSNEEGCVFSKKIHLRAQRIFS